MSEPLEQVLFYHQATKHDFHRFARGPSYLDWATQPDPFRRYHGAPLLQLDQIPPKESPAYEPAFFTGHISPQPLNRHSVSQLLFDSLALSAWKQAGEETWSLRVNPSSGNLHPTEGYLLCGPVPGLTEAPLVAHYAPREHALEVRAQLALATWRVLVAGLPADSVLVGLSSILWREAWKYGERAFRYCQHDVGHAIAALSLAAAGLGWQATLLDDLATRQLASLLGLSAAGEAEAEHPDCLLAIYPQGQTIASLSLPEDALAGFVRVSWQGRPNRLSPRHVRWSIIDDVAVATEKSPGETAYGERPEPAKVSSLELAQGNTAGSPETAESPAQAGLASPLLRQIIRQRRSAVAMDGRSSIGRDVFFKMLAKTLAAPGQFPFNALPWAPQVHLALFVHRVEGLEPGLYLLVREARQRAALQAAMKDGFAWDSPAACPAGLGLYRLVAGDARATARQLSCQQQIAADGCFSLGMIARFEEPLQRFGPWFYRRLFWECGMIGQVLYLEAEAASVRGTGIGCFFDEPVHQLLGLRTMDYQSLYHFTVGHPVEDPRLTTLAAYS